MQIRPIQPANSWNTKKGHRAQHFIFNQFQHANNCCLASRREGVALHAAKAHEVRADRKGLYDVRPPTKPSIDHHFCLAGHSVDDFGQHIHGSSAMVELATTMVRNIYPVHAMIDRDTSILDRGNAFQHNRNVGGVLDQFDGSPIEPGLIRLTSPFSQSSYAIAIGNIPVAASKDRAIDGYADCGTAAGKRTTNVFMYETIVASDVKLRHS